MATRTRTPVDAVLAAHCLFSASNSSLFVGAGALLEAEVAPPRSVPTGHARSQGGRGGDCGASSQRFHLDRVQTLTLLFPAFEIRAHQYLMVLFTQISVAVFQTYPLPLGREVRVGRSPARGVTVSQWRILNL